MQRGGLTDLEKLRHYLEKKLAEIMEDTRLTVELIPEHRRCVYERSTGFSDLLELSGLSESDFQVFDRPPEEPSEERPVFSPQFLVKCSPDCTITLTERNAVLHLFNTVFRREFPYEDELIETTLQLSPSCPQEAGSQSFAISLGVPPVIAWQQVLKKDARFLEKECGGAQLGG